MIRIRGLVPLLALEPTFSRPNPCPAPNVDWGHGCYWPEGVLLMFAGACLLFAILILAGWAESRPRKG